MVAGPGGLDQAWGFADPAKAHAAGVRVVSMYLSWDSSKNITPAKVKAYHQAGIGVLLNWESMAGAPLKGAGQGTNDATEAVRQAKALIAAVGHRPGNEPVTLYFSCDVDTSPGQYPAIEAYYRAARKVCNAAGFKVGTYGEFDLVEHLAGKGITQGEWQTLAWSGGRLSSYADFYQYQINQNLGGAAVDFDRVLHPRQLGAWWPAGSEYDRQPAPNPPAVVPAPAKPPVKPSAPAAVTPSKPNPSEAPVAAGRTLTDADIKAIWDYQIIRIGPDGERWSKSAGNRLVDVALIRDYAVSILRKLGVKI